MYREHIAQEDERVLPLAAQAFSMQQIAQLGREMAARRGLAVPGSPQQTNEQRARQ